MTINLNNAAVPFDLEGPQPLIRDIAAGATYPVEALGPLRDAVEALQGMTQAPIEIPAASALTVASLAVQGFADVETLGGSRPTSIFALTVARSGERKSASDAPLMEALREFERERANVHRDEKADWQNKHAIWKGKRDSILKEVTNGKGEKKVGAEADLDALGPEPIAPASSDRTVTEPTFESLTKLFATGQPSLGLFSDEGGQFLGGHAMSRDNQQKTLAAFNDLWQGNPIRRTRAGDGHATIFGCRLAAHLMVQPTIARAFMANPLAVDTGFLPRFLICEPPSNIGKRLHANARLNGSALDAFSRRLRAILDHPMPIDEETRELKPRVLPLSIEARDLLIAFADEVEVKQAKDGALSHITGYASKAAEQAARIAGVLAQFKDLDAARVSEDDMANGIKLATFYLSEATRLTDVALVSQEIEQAEKLRQWLLNSWEHPEITARDVVQHGPNKLRDTQQARTTLTLLEKYGWIVRLVDDSVVRGSFRKEAWRIVRTPEDWV